MIVRSATVLLLALALGACSLAPTHERPAVPVPARWEGAAVETTQAPARWWAQFGNAELDALVDRALGANHDLAAALQRIEQARATSLGARAALLPSADASAGVTRRKDGDGTQGDAGVAVRYELDLFGGNRASADAARARLDATAFDHDALALVLQAEVAATYIQILALKDRAAIAAKNLDAARKLLELVEVRVDNGAATGLDLARQRSTLLGIEASLPSLQQALAESQHALAVLLGEPPQGFAVRGASLAELELPLPLAQTPARVVERRPDIRAAEARLQAAGADVGAARAALFPRLDLSISAGVAGVLSGGSTTLASIAAGLAQTLFDGGRRRAGVAGSEAARRELVERYAQAVLESLREVEDSLAAYEANRQRAALLAAGVEQAREAHRLAMIRYESGAEDLLTLLDSQRSLLAAEDSLVQTQSGRHLAAVNLAKALGG